MSALRRNATAPTAKAPEVAEPDDSALYWTTTMPDRVYFNPMDGSSTVTPGEVVKTRIPDCLLNRPAPPPQFTTGQVCPCCRMVHADPTVEWHRNPGDGQFYDDHCARAVVEGLALNWGPDAGLIVRIMDEPSIPSCFSGEIRRYDVLPPDHFSADTPLAWLDLEKLGAEILAAREAAKPPPRPSVKVVAE